MPEKTRYQTLCLVVLAGLSALAGGYFQYLYAKDKPVKTAIPLPADTVVLLNFWASWCPPCRKEIPDLVRLQQKYQQRGFSVVGVALDSEEQVAAFLDQMPINYPNHVVGAEGYAWLEAYGSEHGALPYSVLLDRAHNIIYKHHNGLISYDEGKTIIAPAL